MRSQLVGSYSTNFWVESPMSWDYGYAQYKIGFLVDSDSHTLYLD